MWRSPTVTYIWRVQSNPIPNLDFDRWRFCCSFQVISFYLLFFVKLQTSVKHTLCCPSLQQLAAPMTRRGKKDALPFKSDSEMNGAMSVSSALPKSDLTAQAWNRQLLVKPPSSCSKQALSFIPSMDKNTNCSCSPMSTSSSCLRVSGARGCWLHSSRFSILRLHRRPGSLVTPPLTRGRALGRRHATAPAECGISRDANKRQIPYAASPTTGDPF